MENIKVDSYQELLKKYLSVFVDYDNNFDTIAGKNEKDVFCKKFNIINPKLKIFMPLFSKRKKDID